MPSTWPPQRRSDFAWAASTLVAGRDGSVVAALPRSAIEEHDQLIVALTVIESLLRRESYEWARRVDPGSSGSILRIKIRLAVRARSCVCADDLATLNAAVEVARSSYRRKAEHQDRNRAKEGPEKKPRLRQPSFCVANHAAGSPNTTADTMIAPTMYPTANWIRSFTDGLPSCGPEMATVTVVWAKLEGPTARVGQQLALADQSKEKSDRQLRSAPSSGPASFGHSTRWRGCHCRHWAWHRAVRHREG